MSTLRVSTIQDTAGSNSSTPAAIANGIAKAWVNFNGTGVVAIRAQYNVSSITDEATGKFTVNFTTAFADTSYILCGSGSFRDGTDDSNSFKVCHRRLSSGTLTTSACAITTASSGDNFSDPVIACVAFFR